MRADAERVAVLLKRRRDLETGGAGFTFKKRQAASPGTHCGKPSKIPRTLIEWPGVLTMLCLRL
jgi:hypothetical protein